MRAAFSSELVELAKNDERVLLLTGDHGYALFDEFRRVFPDRYLNAGVAEQNMVGVAAGLAKAGFRPIVYGLSSFVPIRVLEQIKLDVCYESLPVVFIGDGAGLVYSTLGSSHQSAEDISALRAIANITILSPADAWEMRESLHLAARLAHPVYLRMGKADRGNIHANPPGVQLGEVLPVFIGDANVALLATGSMVAMAVDVASHLPPGAVNIWSVPSIKPLSTDVIRQISQDHRVIFTLEEHSIYGGLGSAVAEIVSEYGGASVRRIGIKDRFSASAGSWEHLMREHGLDASSILSIVSGALEQRDAVMV